MPRVIKTTYWIIQGWLKVRNIISLFGPKQTINATTFIVLIFYTVLTNSLVFCTKKVISQNKGYRRPQILDICLQMQEKNSHEYNESSQAPK